MPTLFRFYIMAIACASLMRPVVAAPTVSAAHARSLFPAVAKVMLQRDTTAALLGFCARQFKPLKSEAQRAHNNWLQRNHTILDKAKTLLARLTQSVKQQQPQSKAEAITRDIHQLVHENVQKEIHTLAAFSPVQQHTVCNHLILSVNNGDWDVKHKQAQAYSILQKFH